ncbi:MAG: transferase, partial [Chthoniobacterales bacterium]|nr:transferase [Chthoniobacterales bacterium]
MKILRCIHSLDPAIGGPLESVRQSSLVLTRRGHGVEVVSLDAPGQPWQRDFPATV